MCVLSKDKLKNIALLTDFGSESYYVGVMKGVIFSINPNVNVIDITHDVKKHDVLEGAFILLVTYKYFQRGTIFTAVIDPGVGTDREPMLIITKNYYFIGPNNGLLYPTAVRDGIERVFILNNKNFFLENVSATFHGRDIFAPVAAYLSMGIPPEELGREVPRERIIKCEILNYVREKEVIKGKVVYVDRFGNMITNIPNNELKSLKLGDSVEIKVSGKHAIGVYKKTYGEGVKGEILILNGSHGFIEVAMNMDSACKYFNCKRGHPISLKFIK